MMRISDGLENAERVTWARRVDDVCEQFEAAWLAGERPQIEAYLDQAEPEFRAILFRELLQLEIGLRCDQNDTVANSDYDTRFPQYTQVIDEAVNDLAAQTRVDETADRYLLLEEIGRGGVGVVYRAEDRQLERRVAVKALRPEHGHAPQSVRRMVYESKICGGLQHPGVPSVHELGRLADGRPFLAMKLVEGTTLADRLARRPDPKHELTHWLGVLELVCQTVAFAHAQGVIHRDLKPSNVMVGAFGEVQIMDWGLAKRLRNADCGMRIERGIALKSEIQNQQFTHSGELLGTPAYLSPEQASGRIEHVDRRTDVFALGAILCEILTGAPAYVAKSVGDVIDAAKRADLADAGRRLRECGAADELFRLCSDCLRADANERPQDATAVSNRLSAHLEGAVERLQQAEVAQARAEVELAARRRRQRLWIGFVSVALLLLTVVTIGSLTAAARFRRLETKQRSLAESNAALAEDNGDRHREAVAALAEAEVSDRQARQSLADMFCVQGQHAEGEQQMNLAALWFCEAARIADGYDPRRKRMNAIRALNALNTCPQPVAILERAEYRPDRLILHPGNQWLIIKPYSRQVSDLLWNLQSSEVHRFPSELGNVTTLAWNPDGDRLAAGTANGQLFVLDFPSMEKFTPLVLGLETRAMIGEMEFSPRGSRLAAATDNEVFVFDTADDEARPIHVVETEINRGVLFSPSDAHLVTLGCDNVCRAYSLASIGAKPLEVPHQVDENLVWRVCRPIFDSHDRLVTIAAKIYWTELTTGKQQENAAPRDGRTFHLVDVPNRDAVCVMNHNWTYLCRPNAPAECIYVGSLLSGVVHASSESLILGGAAARMRQLTPRDDVCRLYPMFSPDRILTMGLSPDGQLLAISDYSHRITVWQMPQANPFHVTIPAGRRGSCGWPANKGSDKGDGAHLSEAPEGPFRQMGSVPFVASPCSRVLIRRTYRNAQIHRLEDGSSEGLPLVPDGTLLEAAWSADEQSVITLSRREDATRAAVLDIWDWRSGERRRDSMEYPVEPADRNRRDMSTLAIRPAGDRVAFVAQDGRVIVASLNDPDRWHEITGHRYASVFAGNSFDGLVLATGKAPVTLARTDWLEPALTATLDSPVIRGCCYGPHGDVLGLGLNDGVMLVDAETLEPIADPLPHPTWTYVAAISDGGTYVATTCNDDYIRVWNTATRRPTSPPIRRPTEQQPALTRDGSLLIAAGTNAVCRVFDVQTGLRICPEFTIGSPLSLGGPANLRTSVSPDGRFVIIGGTDCVSIVDCKRVLPEPPADLERLLSRCEIVSGHRFEQGRLVALTLEERLGRWKECRGD